MSGKPLKSFTNTTGVDMKMVEEDRRRRERGGKPEVVERYLFGLSVVTNDAAVGADPIKFIEDLLGANGVAVKYLGKYLPD